MTRPIYQIKAEFFRVLAHPARIRVLELLRDGERSVAELVPDVGLEASHLSQQLGVLRRAGIVESRKESTTVIYSVADPRIFDLLGVAKAILTSRMAQSRALLAELEALDFGANAKRRRGAG